MEKNQGLSTTSRDNPSQELKLDLLGKAIRTLRIEKNLTQAELGEKSGVSRAQISMIENSLEDDVSLKMITKIFKAMNAKLKFVVDG